MFGRLIACAAILFIGATIARAEDKKDDTTTKVTVTVIVPKDVASFDGRVLELRLYSIDKRIADKAADLVERVEIKDFTHATGKETKKEFTIGAKGELNANNRYYVTAFVLKGEERTHIGQADHVKEPFNKVLTDGSPREVTIRFKEVGKK
ncbi:hypothetical protein J8F10_23145 [Gemmata sp. G18]|uniref:Uncharacterized protein n=1 Tax=Gemmata palustris TaxID=2822762 RepID=A0ABS5BWN8_9BACT|nr:hypothetical protein [Gemmata palustris]MBP3958156.1 hypothetical protein [Gemmata palustris]